VSVKSNLEFLDFSCEREREKSTPPPALQRMDVEKNVNHRDHEPRASVGDPGLGGVSYTNWGGFPIQYVS